MFFLRKKKQKKDLEAGLVFQWRGSTKHHLGKVIALMITIVFFAFSVYALKVETIKPPLLSKRKGVVIMLNEDDPHCAKLMMQIEGKSPFPVRWDPVFDREVMVRIEEAVEGLVGARWQYDAELTPMPIEKLLGGLESIIEPNDGLLGHVMNDWTEGPQADLAVPSGDLSIRIRVRTGDALKLRLPAEEFLLPPDLIADDSFGQSFRFMVELDASGIVRSCVSLPGGTMDATKATDLQKDLATWLRLQKFNAAKKGEAVTGQLELQIEANRE